MKKINENTLQTQFGIIGGVESFAQYPNGEVKSVTLNEKNMVVTHIGELVPRYGDITPRTKNKPSISFHENGLVKSVYLEEQQEVLTPIGELPAEFVSFFNTGELKRIFPVYGQISGFWSEEDENELNIPLNFEFEFTKFNSKLVGISFYKSGDIRSITLFPGEIINAKTIYGDIAVKNGFSMYENGSLESIEPAFQTTLTTPIGLITAFDLNANGINADSNSLIFNENGQIIQLTTCTDKIAVHSADGKLKFITPIEVENPENIDEKIILGTVIKFDYENDIVKFINDQTYTFSISTSNFNIFKSNNPTSCSPEDCASCSLCNK